ncbi:hypothetical protein BRM3_14825 [Brachybacterium huguangmaarense]|uniref:PepSY domain-containing protein n=1 Tax=Brachybacterium huguangmaarense TaxID=1652028 RepID=A0ABY6G0Y1_9MICO|nr:hypothetical protein [Brachybacterium huguangmaarense]UYG16852.1 hypothetical protein BRM3_14825 [Brachybacterium huguangmaarense]
MIPTLRRTLVRHAVLPPAIGLLALGGLASCTSGADDAEVPSAGPAATVPAPSDGGGSSGPAPSDGGSGTVPSSLQALTEQPGQDTDLRTAAFPVTPEQAIATATDTAGDGTVHAVELDYNRTETWQWEVSVLVDGTDQTC